MMNEFITLEFLTTFTGLVAAVGIIVQFTKSIIKDKFNDGAVRVYSFIVALILTFVFTKNGFTIEGILLTILNSVLITMSATGIYEIIVDPLAEKHK